MSDPIQPLSPEQVAVQEARAAHEAYVHRCAVALDQLANVIADGLPDMTISSRAAIADQKGELWGKGLSRILDFFQKDHGMKAEAGDEARAKDLGQAEKQTLGDA
jgi:hypothetical protein